MGRGYIPELQKFTIFAYYECGYCDFQVEEGEEYCPVCGNKINWEGADYE